MYIYCITNKITNMKYIGKCVRMVSESTNYYGSGIHISASIQKHGIDNFIKEVLEDNISYKNELSLREKFWIKELNTKTPNGYNLTDGGDGCQGMIEETKEKIRQKNRLLVGEKNSRYGKKNTKEHNDILRKVNTGKIVSQETRDKIRQNQLGKSRPKDVIKKTRQSNLGRKHSEEWNKKVRENQPHALKVSQYTKTGEFVADYPSAIKACRQTGINNSSIANCCKGKTKSAGRFIWKFSKDVS